MLVKPSGARTFGVLNQEYLDRGSWQLTHWITSEATSRATAAPSR